MSEIWTFQQHMRNTRHIYILYIRRVMLGVKINLTFMDQLFYFLAKVPL